MFVSDGSKCDISRLQAMFGPTVSVAVQDPAYPVRAPSTFPSEPHLSFVPHLLLNVHPRCSP